MKARRTDALVVLNPRRVEPCMRALDELDIPQIRIIGYTEKQIADDVFPEILDLDYEWLWVVSDDAIVRPTALAAVRALMRKHPVVTGYSQRCHTDWIVNLSKSRLGSHPGPNAYDFYEYREVVSWPDAVVPTYFAGMSLTGMSMEMWKTFPFSCFGGTRGDKGYSSDFHLSQRLQEKGIPIVAAREGFCYHWRTDWRSTGSNEDQKPDFSNKRVEIVHERPDL